MDQSVTTPSREARLRERMIALGVREEDIEEVFVRSSGHGGQNVNKTSTCVVLRHRPSGLQVRCQATRQQGMNRFLARCQLLDRIEEERRERERLRTMAREKERRQKRPRSHGAKVRMLAAKAHQARRKEHRRRVRVED